jgi:hypothetical protein
MEVVVWAEAVRTPNMLKNGRTRGRASRFIGNAPMLYLLRVVARGAVVHGARGPMG